MTPRPKRKPRFAPSGPRQFPSDPPPEPPDDSGGAYIELTPEEFGGQRRLGYAVSSVGGGNPDDAWAWALDDYNGNIWEDISVHASGFTGLYECTISGHPAWCAHIIMKRAKYRYDFTDYSKDLYSEAKLYLWARLYWDAFHPHGSGYTENTWVFLEDITEHLGTNWVGNTYYATNYEPARPSDNTGHGWGLCDVKIILKKKTL